MLVAAYVFEVLLVLLFSCGGGKPKAKTKPQILALFKGVKL